MPYNDTDFLILVTFSEEMVFGFIEERYVICIDFCQITHGMECILKVFLMNLYNL